MSWGLSISDCRRCLIKVVTRGPSGVWREMTPVKRVKMIAFKLGSPDSHLRDGEASSRVSSSYLSTFSSSDFIWNTKASLTHFHLKEGEMYCWQNHLKTTRLEDQWERVGLEVIKEGTLGPKDRERWLIRLCDQQGEFRYEDPGALSSLKNAGVQHRSLLIESWSWVG